MFSSTHAECISALTLQDWIYRRYKYSSFFFKKKLPINPHSVLWHGVSLEEFWLKHRMFSHARQWKDSNMNLTVWPNTLHLFEHLNYTYTMKLNSDIFRWQTPPPSRKTTPQTKKHHYYQLSCHAYVAMFHIPCNTELFVTPLMCVLAWLYRQVCSSC